MGTIRPILVTGVPRSGATFIIRILEMCGGKIGLCSSMYQNVLVDNIIDNILLQDIRFPIISQDKVDRVVYPIFKDLVNKTLGKQQLNRGKAVIKNSGFSLTWRYWHELFPNAQWVIVRRKSPYIVNSCIKTAYMTLMKDESNLRLLGLSEKEAWMWYIHRFEEQWLAMSEAGLDLKEVYPDRMENNDYRRIEQLVVDLGLEWNDKIIGIMNTYFEKEVNYGY